MGSVLIVNQRTDKTIRYVEEFVEEFVAEFERDNELLPTYMDVDDLTFPEVGEYSFQVLFYARGRGDVFEGRAAFSRLP